MAASRRFRHDTRGATAVEFTLIAPLFFLLVFSILEIALAGWFSNIVSAGAEQGATYMREQRLSGEAISEAGLRAAICDAVDSSGIACGADTLKIGTFDASAPDGQGSFGIPQIIDNNDGLASGVSDQYIIAVGYYWGLNFLTSGILLPTGTNGTQIQARVYTVLAERVWDDGVRR